MSQIILTTELPREECVRRLRVALEQRPKRALGRIGAHAFTLSGRPRWYGRRGFLNLRLRGRFVQSAASGTQIACDTGSAWVDLVGALVGAILIAGLSGLILHRSLQGDAGFAFGFFVVSCALILVRRVLVRPNLLRGEGAALMGLVKSACQADEA